MAPASPSAAASLSLLKACKTKPGAAQRRPRPAARRNSARRVSRASVDIPRLLGAEPLAPLGATASQNPLTAGGRLAAAEPMAPLADQHTGLIGALHDENSLTVGLAARLNSSGRVYRRADVLSIALTVSDCDLASHGRGSSFALPWFVGADLVAGERSDRAPHQTCASLSPRGARQRGVQHVARAARRRRRKPWRRR